MESDGELSVANSYSSDNPEPENSPNPKDNRQIQFISIVKKFPIVLNKSQTPLIKKQKKEALSAISRACLTHFGETITQNKILKKLNNMKTELKKKTDRKATGNKAIRLKDWERNLLELLEGQRGENPTIRQVPGASSSGVTNSTFDILEDPQTSKSQLPLRPSAPKKNKFAVENEETRNLTNGELQRLVLLEQLKLIRLQQERIKNNNITLFDDSYSIL